MGMSIRKRDETADKKILPSKFVQAKAEDLPFEEEEFDAVICMYLYHEIPREIRAKVSAEMSRVTKTGGCIILTDSYQQGDRDPCEGVCGDVTSNKNGWMYHFDGFLPARRQ